MCQRASRRVQLVHGEDLSRVRTKPRVSSLDHSRTSELRVYGSQLPSQRAVNLIASLTTSDRCHVDHCISTHLVGANTTEASKAAGCGFVARRDGFTRCIAPTTDTAGSDRSVSNLQL